MTADPPARRRPRAVPDATSSDAGFDDLLQVLGEQLGEATQSADPRSRRKLKNVTFEYEPDHTAVHDMAGDAGYSLASNWFTQLLAQLAVANSITKSQLCVFLYVAGDSNAAPASPSTPSRRSPTASTGWPHRRAASASRAPPSTAPSRPWSATSGSSSWATA